MAPRAFSRAVLRDAFYNASRLASSPGKSPHKYSHCFYAGPARKRLVQRQKTQKVIKYNSC